MKTFKHAILSATLLLFSAFGYAAQVNINTADIAELATSIAGVGPSKAAAIIEYRDQYGPFVSVDDLAKVKGIGQKTVEDNREILTIE